MSGATHKSDRIDSNYDDEPELSKQWEHNSKLSINRLPPEILSRIMLIGVEYDHQVWRWESRNTQSQQTASCVCRYWREVAINTPTLWTFVHITSARPSDHIALHIYRAGSTTPLDIAIDLFLAFNTYGVGQFERDANIYSSPRRYTHELFGTLSHILRALATGGAETSRWRSLLIRTDQIEARKLSRLIDCIGQISVPNLQRLRFDYCHKMHPSRFRHYILDYSTGEISGRARSFFESLSSSLRCLELVLPYQFTFGSIWAFTNLKELTIISHRLGQAELSNLLGSNPQLESLCLGDGSRLLNPYRRLDQADSDSVPSHHTFCPSLRSLFIQTQDDTAWALRMLATIESPGLHNLVLKCASKSVENVRSLVAYITTGSFPTNLTKDSSSRGNPIYPSLQSLDISRFTCDEQQFTDLILSFPYLVRLVLREQFLWLDKTPWILPQLESLGTLDLPARAEILIKFLSRRADAGKPIKEVEAQGGFLRLTTKQNKPPGSIMNQRSVGLEYEYYQYEDDTVIGDFQSLERRSANSPLGF